MPSDTQVNPSATLSSMSPTAAMVVPGWAGGPRSVWRAAGKGERISTLSGAQTSEPPGALGTRALGGTFPPDFIPAVFKAPNLLITRFSFEVLESGGQPHCHALPASQLCIWAQPCAWVGLGGARNWFICTDDKTSVARTLHLLGALPSRTHRFLHLLSQHLLDGSGKQLLGCG